MRRWDNTFEVSHHSSLSERSNDFRQQRTVFPSEPWDRATSSEVICSANPSCNSSSWLRCRPRPPRPRMRCFRCFLLPKRRKCFSMVFFCFACFRRVSGPARDVTLPKCSFHTAATTREYSLRRDFVRSLCTGFHTSICS